MPIYEYRCRSCGHQVEVIQKIGERARRKCSKCSGRMEKLVSRTSFLLKGGGWYAEGYSKSSTGKSEKSSGEAKPKTSGKGGGSKAGSSSSSSD